MGPGADLCGVVFNASDIVPGQQDTAHLGYIQPLEGRTAQGSIIKVETVNVNNCIHGARKNRGRLRGLAPSFRRTWGDLFTSYTINVRNAIFFMGYFYIISE